MPLPPDLQTFVEQYAATERDARALLAGLPEALALHQPQDSWSVAQCLDHLGMTNRAYLAAMEAPVVQARMQGLKRKGPVRPGPFGALFARNAEPPVRRLRIPAPKSIAPAEHGSLDQATESYFSSHRLLEKFIEQNADLDLTHIRFPNPFIRGVNFGAASGLQIMAAHERRHLWQAWNVRRLAESATRAAAV